MESARIENIAYYLPSRIRDNAYLQSELGIDEDFLENKIGIKERRIAEPTESTADMAVQAAERLFAIDPSLRQAVGLLILCTQTPDYTLPTTACLVQHRLGLRTQCLAFDINLGCSGFVYSFAVAAACLRTGMTRKAIVITTDQYSRILNPADRNTVAVFGDAASCTSIGLASQTRGLIDHDFGTDGSGATSLIAYNSGTVQDPKLSPFLYMNGREIFKFSVTNIPDSVRRLLTRNALNVTDIKLFIFHQANKYMLKELQKRLAIGDEQMVIDLTFTGNTVSSTIPIALEKVIKNSRLSPGDKVILCGFGVGLSWGSLLYIY